MGELVDLRETKGPMAMKQEDLQDLQASALQLSAQVSPSPQLTLLCVLGQYSKPSSAVLLLHLEQSANWELPKRYWGAIPLRKA